MSSTRTESAKRSLTRSGAKQGGTAGKLLALSHKFFVLWGEKFFVDQDRCFCYFMWLTYLSFKDLVQVLWAKSLGHKTWHITHHRSEERRVGKECRSRW